MAEKNTFRLVIASVSKSQYDGPALSATLPGSSGEFTVLAHHQPFITTLKKGTICVRDASGTKKDYPVESGAFEFSTSRAVVLL